MSVLENLIAKIGGRDAIHPRSRAGKALRGGGVQDTPEFKRIKNIPRREWRDQDIEKLVRLTTDYLRVPGGTWDLRPVQAVALQEIHDYRGGFLPVPVGEGKALISLLAPVVMRAQRPLLLVPASLKAQTEAQVIPQMRSEFVLHPQLVIQSYESLSRVSGAEFLDVMKPDMIICDEAHYLRHKTAGRTKRFLRYLTKHPNTILVCMSGTITKRSLMDYHHLIKACLPNHSPLPNSWTEVQDWCDALDEIKGARTMDPGALLQFCDGDELPRQGYGRRLRQTPGVVTLNETDLGTSLIISKRSLGLPDAVQSALRKLRTEWVTPGGNDISEAIELWRHGREIACGFYYQWVWPKDHEGKDIVNKEWLAKRKAWKSYARNVLKYNRSQLDTELQVALACSKDEIGRVEYDEWVAVRDEYVPVTEAVWISDYILHDIFAWLEESANPGIVWVEHTELGEALALRKLPYFGGGGKASKDILTAKGHIAASIAAHGTGKNMQRYARNLIVSVPPSGDRWQQLLGRTHRQGQIADEVTADLYLHTDELKISFGQARRDAQYLFESTGEKQKLLYGTYTFTPEV